MLDKLFGPDLTNLQNAMTRASQRHVLLANNLANVNVPGYKRQDMDFHITLQGQLGSSPALAAQNQASAQAAEDETSMRSDGNNVDIEKEVTGLSETSLQYQALITVASDYFSGLKLVIKS